MENLTYIKVEGVLDSVFKKHFKNYTPKKTLLGVAQATAEAWDISLEVLRGPGSTRKLVEARAGAYVLASNLGYSLNEISSFFNRHHTTVIHSLKLGRENGN